MDSKATTHFISIEQAYETNLASDNSAYKKYAPGKELLERAKECERAADPDANKYFGERDVEYLRRDMEDKICWQIDTLGKVNSYLIRNYEHLLSIIDKFGQIEHTYENDNFYDLMYFVYHMLPRTSIYERAENNNARFTIYNAARFGLDWKQVKHATDARHNYEDENHMYERMHRGASEEELVNIKQNN